MLTAEKLKFCTYFKRLDKFVHEYEVYDYYTLFCVKKGSFRYKIGESGTEVASDGEIIICPPEKAFYREIVDPVELCMMQVQADDSFIFSTNKIRITNTIRYNDDLNKLVDCVYCHTFSQDTIYLHYCNDILYLALDSITDHSELKEVKLYIEQNYDKNINVDSLAKKSGYTTPYLIYKFKSAYGLPPKAYQNNIRLQKAKELLLTTDLMSREIASAVGFSDELYFIRFFKKHIGLTPKQFTKQNAL